MKVTLNSIMFDYDFYIKKEQCSILIQYERKTYSAILQWPSKSNRILSSLRSLKGKRNHETFINKLEVIIIIPIDNTVSM